MVEEIKTRLNGHLKLIPIYVLLIGYIIHGVMWGGGINEKTQQYDQHLVEAKVAMNDFYALKTDLALLKQQNALILKELDEIKVLIKRR